MSGPQVKARRLAAGFYRVDTDVGEFEVFEFARGRWFIQWPGRTIPDGEAETLRHALYKIRHEVKILTRERRHDG